MGVARSGRRATREYEKMGLLVDESENTIPTMRKQIHFGECDYRGDKFVTCECLKNSDLRPAKKLKSNFKGATCSKDLRWHEGRQWSTRGFCPRKGAFTQFCSFQTWDLIRGM